MAVATASEVLCTASSRASVSVASPSNLPVSFIDGECTTRTLRGLPPYVPSNSDTSGKYTVVASLPWYQPPADSFFEHLLPGCFSFFLPGMEYPWTPTLSNREPVFCTCLL